MNQVPASNSCADGCFTAIAITALLGKGSYVLAKHSVYEGWLTCKSGWNETRKAVRHLSGAAAALFEHVGELVSRVFHEMGSLFLIQNDVMRGVRAAKDALGSGAECAKWAASPLDEIYPLICLSGGLSTDRAMLGLEEACTSATEVLSHTTSPFIQESYQTLASSKKGIPKMCGALRNMSHAGADIGHAALDGFARELVDLFVTSLTTIGKTGNAAKESVKSWLSLSKESSYRFLMEAADTFEVGSEECRRTLASLPPALKAFFQIPAVGIEALLKECIHTLKSGADESRKTFREIYHAATVGIDLLKVTLLSSLLECAHTGKSGASQSQKALYAIAQAIDHGTEGLRSTLLALLLESGSALFSGLRSILKTGQAAEQAITHGEEMVMPCKAFLKETESTFKSGVRESQRAMLGSAHAIATSSYPLRDLATRSYMEALDMVRPSKNPNKENSSATLQTARDLLSLLVEWPVSSASEAKDVALKGIEETKRFDFQMSDEVPRSLNVHLYYPAKKVIVPKIQAIRLAYRQKIKAIEAKMSALWASLSGA